MSNTKIYVEQARRQFTNDKGDSDSDDCYTKIQAWRSTALRSMWIIPRVAFGRNLSIYVENQKAHVSFAQPGVLRFDRQGLPQVKRSIAHHL